MRGITLGTVIVVFFLLQVLLVDRIAFGRIQPDFPLLIVVYYAVFRGTVKGAGVGFIVGVLQDLFNPSHLGLNALAKTITGYALGIAGKKTEPESSVFLFGLIGGAALAHDIIYLLIFTGLHPGRFFLVFATVSIPAALYTAVVGVLVHKLVSVSFGEAVRYVGKARSQG